MHAKPELFDAYEDYEPQDDDNDAAASEPHDVKVISLTDVRTIEDLLDGEWVRDAHGQSGCRIAARRTK